ncbi:MAG: gliding motility-associated C-terminal domain-containing protein [Bacteroidales bacterium]|nr:gliding motility-associated C-terminal domain-containing protein [Bacteroidales bacterium]
MPVVKDVCGNTLTAPTPVVTDNPDPLTCGGTRTYTYTYKDCANLEFVWAYTYTISHTNAPSEVGGPVATTGTAECLADASAPATLPVVKDVCGNTLTAPTPVVTDNPNPITCGGTREYTYIYKDCANLEFVWTYTYTISHTTAPSEVGGPVATTGTAECIADATAPTNLPVVKDVCGNTLSAPTPVVTDNPDPITCGGTRTYTYTYKDCANLEFVWTYTYTIAHTTAPSEVGGPVATTGTAGCLVDATAPTTLPVVKDVCGNTLTAPTPVVTDNPDPMTCDGTRTYTYTYKDCANKEFVWTYTYTIERSDFDMPDNDGATVACASEITAPTLPEVTDACGNALTGVLKSGYPTETPTCNGDVRYVYTFTDCKGTAHDWTFTYTIERNIDPSFSGTWPNDISNQNVCYADRDISGLLADDDVADMYTAACGTISVSHSDVADPTSNCGWTVTRTYTITDGCNEVTNTMSVSGGDQTAPTIGDDDLDRELTSTDCVFIVPNLTDDVRAISSDNCTANAELTITQSPVAGTEISAETTVTVTVTDQCSKSSTKQIVLTIPEELTASMNATTPACSGGTTSASVIVNGGTSPYEYHWSDDGSRTGNIATDIDAGYYQVSVSDSNGCSTEANIDISNPDELIATISADAIYCHNATTNITVNVQNGTPDYTYIWSDDDTRNSNIASGVSAGSYEVLVSDANGCTAIASIEISNPEELTASMSADAIYCHDATTNITVDVQNGAADYTYVWSDDDTRNGNTASNVSSGSYTVYVTDAHDCTAVASIEISNPEEFTASMSADAIYCHDATTNITVNVQNGTPDYTYIWSDDDTRNGNTASDVSAGSYTVSVTDAHDCIAIASIEISNPEEFTASMSADAINCYGETTNITVNVENGTPDYTYIWSDDDTRNGNTASDVSEGIYTVTVRDVHSCSVEASITITQPDEIIITVESTSPQICETLGSITVSAEGGTGELSYAWSTTAHEVTYSELTAGNYTVTVTDENRCSATRTIEVEDHSVIPDVDITNNTGVTVITCAVTEISLTAEGTGDFEWSNGEAGAELTVTTPNDYTVTITDANGCVNTATITIEQSNENPVVTLVDDNITICAGQTATVTIDEVTNGVAPYHYSWNGGTYGDYTEFTTSPLSADDAVTVDVKDENGCIGSATASITVNNRPTAEISGGEAICNGEGASFTITFTGAPTYNYTWSDGNDEHSGSTDDSSVTITVTPTSTTTYTLVSLSDANCASIDSDLTGSVEIIVNEMPTAAIATTDNIMCVAPFSGVIAVDGFGPETGDYTVSLEGTGISAQTVAYDEVASFTELAAGNYDVQFSYTANSHTCSTVVPVTISDELSYPSVDVTAFNNGCAGENNGTIEILASNGTPDYTYAWTDADDNVVTCDADGNLSGLGTGTYTVTVTDAHGCATSTSQSISSPDVALSATISGPTEVCNNTTATLTVNAEHGTPDYSYEWNDAAHTITASITTPTLDGNNTPFTYNVVVTDANGCTMEASHTVTIGDTPQLELSADAEICYGSNATLTSTVTNAGANYSIEWTSTDAGAGLPANVDTEEIVVTPTSTSTYTATLTTDVCNTGSDYVVIDNISVTVNPKPEVDITTVNANVCPEAVIDLEAELTAEGTADYTYTWSASAGLTLAETGDITTDATTTTNSVAAPEASATSCGATYSINLHVVDANGCTADAMPMEITVVDDVAPEIGTADLDRTLTSTDCTFTIPDLTGEVRAISSDNCTDVDALTITQNPSAGEEIAAQSTVTVTVTDQCGTSSAVDIVLRVPDALSLNEVAGSHINATGNGRTDGVLEVFANGGTPEYQYRINDGEYQSSGIFPGLGAGTYTVEVVDANGCTATISIEITEPNVLEATISTPVALLCNGDDTDVTVNVTGGTEPYHFAWSDGNEYDVNVVSGLTAGTYTVTVSDVNNCIAIATVEITQPEQLQASLSADEINCNGETATAIVTVSGGTQDYSYAWSDDNTRTGNTASGLTAGTYTVTVTDANLCSAETEVIISEPTAITISVVSTSPQICETLGSIEVSATGGTGTLSYAWSTTAHDAIYSDLMAGNYTVTVTDENNCSATETIEVEDHSVIPDVSIVNNTGTELLTCDVLEIYLIADGTGEFAWSNGEIGAELTVTTPDNYTVTITDANGCTNSASVRIDQSNGTPIVVLANDDITICAGTSTTVEVASVTGGVTPYEYSWDDGATFGTEPQYATGNLLADGSYSVIVRDANGCTGDAIAIVTVNAPSVGTLGLTGETTICDGSSTALTVVSDNDNVGDLTFAWSNGLGNDATSADITTAGDYSVTITATNVVNTVTCTDEIVLTENISVNVRPTATVSGSTAICADNTDEQMVIFTFTGTAPFVYTWSDGTSSHNETTNNATVTITVTPSETTTYSITALSDANCTATDGDMANSATITVNELPVVVLATPAAICDGQSTTIEIESLTGGTPSYQYSWDGGVTFGSSNEYNTGVLSTDATFSLIVRDANGCTASAETTVSVGENIMPVFADYEACNGDTQIVLPTESENGITGTWSPAIVDMTSSHTYTFTPDPSFCAQQTSIDVTIHDRPTVSVSGSVAICEGNTDGQIITMSFTGVAPYEYTWSDGNGTYSETTNDNVVTIYVTPTATTTYSIVSLQDNNGCSANDLSSSSTVTVNANPTVSIIVPYEEINCRHRTITATATGSEATYDWSNGSSSSTAVFTFAGEYSVIASAPNGCTAEASVEITENLAQPDVAIDNTTGSEWLNCIYTSISVTATGGESYRWSSGQTTAGITITAPNTYIVTATGTNGCEATASIEIHQPEDLAITVSYSEIACHGGTTTVSVTAEGGTPSYGGTGIFPDVSSGTHTYTVTDEGGCSASETIYLADPSDITVIVTYDPVLCNGDATTVTVSAEGGTPYAGSQQYDGTGIRTEHAGHHTYTVSDRNGCESTASITITEPDRLESFATTQDAQCFGMLGTAIIDVTGGTTPYGITWQDGTTGPQNSSVSVGAPFSYMVVDGNGCHISGSVTVSQPELLEVSLTGENVSCAGMADGRIESTVTGGNEPYTYAWSNGGILQNAEWLAPGTYRLTVTDSHSCTSYSSTIITEPQPLAASLYPTDVQCGYMLGTLTATVSGGTPDYAYSWSDSHIAGTGSTEVYSGDYTLTVTDGHGCTATASAGVHVNGGIDARVTVVSGITCPGDSDAVLEATSQQGAEPFTYSWSSGSASQTLIGAGAGTYMVVITDAWGCTGSGQATVESPTAMDVTLTTTDAHCHNTSDGTITVDVTGGTFPYSYAWSEPTFTGSSVSHASAGSYLLTVTDTRGCEVHLVATVGSPEAIVITSNVASISCHGRRDGIVEVSAEGGTEPYYYSLFNGYSTFTGQSTYTHLGEGGYEITAIDANGCQETRNIYVVEPAELTAEVDGVDPSCKGNNDGQILITAVGGTEPYMYGWSDRYSDQPVISALYAGEYTVSVVDANSCAYSANVTINPSYADCLKIPNVFTPNGDGINDTWEIGNIDMFPKAKIYVFNRWGQMIYTGTTDSEFWDGRIRGGSMAPAGTYMYIIHLHTGHEAYEGTVTIAF